MVVEFRLGRSIKKRANVVELGGLRAFAVLTYD